MPKDATATRQRLMKAGARLFATEGVDRARTRDIVELAGQANDSAITYHFGSRRGLLAAILKTGVERMEPARVASLGPLRTAPLRAVVAAILEPTAAELRTEEGRDFLRIVVQVAGQAGIRGHNLPPLIKDTALAAQLAALEDRCRAFLPETLAQERISVFIAFLTAALADRVERDDSHLHHDAFVHDLTDMLTAALAANRFA
ncbi:TetR family transcriptional regulator [Spirillospora sp. CA-255316]